MRTILRMLEVKNLMTEPLQHNTARFEFKATEKRQFTGLASTWDLDQGGDLIEQGAYSRTLREIKRDDRTIPLINQHRYSDTRHAIGKMIAAKETRTGLETTFQVVNSPEGDEFLARITEGIIDGLSIGYEARGWRPPTDAERKIGVQRVLTDVELREVSLVIWGMNQYALIDASSVKSIADALAGLKRETLTDDDRKIVRQIASLSGALLRPLTPAAGDEPPADETDAQKRHKPDASPGSTADTQTAYPHSEALQQRLIALKVGRTLNAGRLTTTRGISR